MIKKCLKCGKTFEAENKFNRLCKSCAKSNAHINADMILIGKGKRKSTVNSIKEKE